MFELLSDRSVRMGFKWAFYLAALITAAAWIALSLGANQETAPAPEPLYEQAELPTPEPEMQTRAPALVQAAAPAASPFAVRSTLALDAEVAPGDFAWNDEGVPAGPLSIVVDIETELLYVYRGGIEIGRSSLIYGADDKPTPLGTFKILQRKRHHISNLYNAPMPYMLRLTMDGVAIHASQVDYNSATHGCIGLPDDFAAKLFAEAGLGDPVLVTKNWMPQVYGQPAAGTI